MSRKNRKKRKTVTRYRSKRTGRRLKKPYKVKTKDYPCEKKAREIAKEKGWSLERARAYVFGGMRRKGWKPSTQK